MSEKPGCARVVTTVEGVQSQPDTGREFKKRGQSFPIADLWLFRALRVRFRHLLAVESFAGAVGLAEEGVKSCPRRCNERNPFDLRRTWTESGQFHATTLRIVGVSATLSAPRRTGLTHGSSR